MLVRLERTKDTSVFLVVDELSSFLGSVREIDFFTQCTHLDLEPIEEDGYIFYHVDKKCLLQKLL